MINKNENITQLADQLKLRLLNIEIVLALLFIIGLGLKMNSISSGGIILTVTLSTLSIIYFITAYSIDAPETPAMTRFINKLTAFSLSILTIAILFEIQNWPGANRMIFAGAGILFFAIVYNIIKIKNFMIILKSTIFLTLALGLYFTPKEKLENLHIIKTVDNSIK